MAYNTNLQMGQVLSNQQIADIFRCSNQGGMRRSHGTNTLVIISDHTKLYEDRKEGEIFHYTGMGRKGDQSLSFAQNKTLVESRTNGVAVFLFRVLKPTEYTFVGQVVLAGEPYQEEQLDEDDKLRKVWIFPLRALEQSQPLIDEIDLLSAVLEGNNEITETEKEQVIKSRIGQSTFKRNLLAIEKKCRLCGVSGERFLVASHIKPWSQSNNQERLDVNNGLLLCPNHDALFDKGYISFDEDGTILISMSLDTITKVFLNVNESIRLEMNESQRQYMKWHRENMFK
ncbi:HNH endonuclease [Bacillus toyonensis]|uniref:HNH endonuclease n=1 Tax=Bacillus cereus group TaxID=86661 RepID=UPI002E1BA893|nr:HNH endonuclease [Bacillus mycoides]